MEWECAEWRRDVERIVRSRGRPCCSRACVPRARAECRRSHPRMASAHLIHARLPGDEELAAGSRLHEFAEAALGDGRLASQGQLGRGVVSDQPHCHHAVAAAALARVPRSHRELSLPRHSAVGKRDAHRHCTLVAVHDEDAGGLEHAPRLLDLLPQRWRLRHLRRAATAAAVAGLWRRLGLLLLGGRRRRRRRCCLLLLLLLHDGDGQHGVAHPT